MDSRKIRLKNLTRGDLLMICQYTDRISGKVISLIDFGKHGRVVDRALLPTETIKQIKFPSGKITNENINQLVYEIEYDRDKRDAEETQVVLRFWANNPKVKNLNGTNKNAVGEPVISMEDLTETRDNKVDSMDKRFKAYQKFAMLGHRGKKNVAYSFGLMGADSMEEKDLNLALADLTGGLLMRDDDSYFEKDGKKVESSLDRFLKYDSDDFKTQLAINTRRAIEKGFIEKKSDHDGTTFYINNHPVASNIEGVIMYLDNNRDFYSKWVIEKLGDEAEGERQAAKERQDREIEVVDLEGLRRSLKEKFERLKLIGVKGSLASKWATLQSPEKMQEAHKEADIILAEKEQKSEVVS